MNMRQNMVNGLLAIAGQALDEDSYVPVAWLASTGPACIDSGVRGDNSNLRIEARVKRVGFSNYRYFYGCYLGEGYNATRLLLNNTDNGSGWACVNTIAGGGSIAVQGLTNNEWHDIVHTQASITVDGIAYTRAVAQGTALGNVNIFLFSSQNKYGSAQASTIYIASFKIYDGELLARDFIPVLRLSDNKPGMYDLVTRAFFVNVGAGEFTYGDTITAADYVQDGLVGLWDGIENSAYGTHADDAQTWTDLVGGIGAAALMAGSRCWKNNGLYVLGGVDRWTIPIGAWFLNRSACTLETAITPKGWYNPSGNNRILSNSNSGGVIIRAGVTGYMVQLYDGSDYKAASYTGAKIPSTVSLIGTASSVSIAVGGEVIKTTATGASRARGSKKLAISYEPDVEGGPETYATYGAMTGTYHAIRLYSKSLTAEELAYNYDIDRRRFLLYSAQGV